MSQHRRLRSLPRHRRPEEAAARDSLRAAEAESNKLEAEIDTPLFTRLHKKLVPTLAGTRLFAIVEPFVKELEVGIPAIKRAREEPHGLLRIGAPVEFGKQYFPSIFAIGILILKPANIKISHCASCH